MHTRLALLSGLVCSIAVLTMFGCTTAPRYTRGGTSPRPSHKAPTRKPARKSPSRGSGKLTGMASYYGPGFHGKTTANGERYDQNGITAAHKTLPFNTRVRVTNLDNGKSVVVRINDRGPYKKGRIIDLSVGAAKKVGMMQSGTAKVRLEILR